MCTGGEGVEVGDHSDRHLGVFEEYETSVTTNCLDPTGYETFLEGPPSLEDLILGR